jgi:hypothetical protein
MIVTVAFQQRRIGGSQAAFKVQCGSHFGMVSDFKFGRLIPLWLT